MNSYKDLIVWQKSLLLTKEIYRITKSFPSSEMYGLTSQLRRASVSVVSNIAEGFSRKSPRENGQFISIAFGSTSEIETQLIIARELSFIAQDAFSDIESILIEVRKMLNVLLSKFREK